MRQIYKVYINNKELFFINIQTTVSKDDTTIIITDPEPDSMAKAVSDFVLNDNLQKLFFITQNPESLFKEFRKNYKVVRAAGGVVRDKDMRILFIFRRGKWDLPKGKIDDEERRKHAALREVREETGLDNLFVIRKIDKTYHIYSEKNEHILKKTYWFEMAAINSEPLIPQADEDITDIRWFEPDKLDEVFANTYPLVANLVKENF
ncbi:MAG TPA: NUDIX domain-containing protein [Bacteroidales bacterium]|nr:NUDIX domain-containing protein [Bacteroidales bacterium]